MAFPPSTNNYAIGKGKLYIADFSTSPNWKPMGNCPSIEIEPQVERLEHFSSMSGLKNRDKYPVVQAKYTVNFDADEICAENLTVFLQGSLSGSGLYGLQNTDKEYSLKFVSDNPIGQNSTWTFHRCVIANNGAMSLIGDDWMTMSFTAEGLADPSNTSSPYFTVEFSSTTTSSFSSTTTSS